MNQMLFSRSKPSDLFLQQNYATVVIEIPNGIMASSNSKLKNKQTNTHKIKSVVQYYGCSQTIRNHRSRLQYYIPTEVAYNTTW